MRFLARAAGVVGGSGDARTETAGDAGQRAPRDGAVLAGERNGFEYVDAPEGSRSRNESFEETIELLREEAAVGGAGRKGDADVDGAGEWSERHGERPEISESAVRGVVGGPHGVATVVVVGGGSSWDELPGVGVS